MTAKRTKPNIQPDSLFSAISDIGTAHYPAWYLKLLGVVFILCAVFVLFVVPTDTLYENSRRMHLGDIFRGVEALVGSFGARIFIALPFAAFSYLLLRKVLTSSKDSND